MRRAFVVIGALMVVAGLANVVVFDWASQATAGKPYDFDLNWIAAQRLVDGRPLYDREASHAEGLRLVGPEMSDTNHGPFSSFIGLPSTALLYAPFTPFDAGTAADLYRLVDLLAMLVAIIVTLLALPPPSRLPAGLIVLGAFLLSTPVNKSIWLGQVDGFLMLGLAVAFLGVARERWGLVGMGIAVAALLKLSPVILLVYLALRGRWRALWWAIGTVFVVLGAAAIVGRPGDLGDWSRTVADSVSQGARITDNQSLPAALARLFTGSDDLIAQAPLGAWRFVSSAVVVTALLGLWWLRRGQRIEPLELGVLVLVALLAGPVRVGPLPHLVAPRGRAGVRRALLGGTVVGRDRAPRRADRRGGCAHADLDHLSLGATGRRTPVPAGDVVDEDGGDRAAARRRGVAAPRPAPGDPDDVSDVPEPELLTSSTPGLTRGLAHGPAVP